MLIIFIRATIIFTVLLIVMRLMGKRQIGEMQPFEFIITLLIAELACAPMADINMPLMYGIVSVLAVFIIHQLISIFEQLGQTAKKIISGKPSIVINKNGVDIKELKANNLDIEDLIEAVRGAGYFALDSVSYAIFESNGNFSIIGKDNSEEPTLPILVVQEGKIVKKNADILKLDGNFWKTFLFEQGIDNIKKIDILTIDGSGKCYLQLKGNKFKVTNIVMKEGIIW